MTALSDLRTEAARHPDGITAKRILTWAEIHIADQFDIICELEDDNKRLYAECAALRQALLSAEVNAAELAEQARAAAYRVTDDAFGKDYAPFQNMLAAHGLKPDGSVKKPRKQKEQSA